MQAQFVPIVDNGGFFPLQLLVIAYSEREATQLRIDHISRSSKNSSLDKESRTPNPITVLETKSKIIRESKAEEASIDLQKNLVVITFIEYYVRDSKAGSVRHLGKIHVYIINPKIINVHESSLKHSPNEYNYEQLQDETEKLHRMYQVHERYSYVNFIGDLNIHLKKYSLHGSITAIFGHALLRMSEIGIQPPKSHIDRSSLSSGGLLLTLEIDKSMAKDLVSRFQEKFGKNSCRDVSGSTDNKITLEFSLIMLLKEWELIKKNIDEILNDALNLFAYQQYENYVKTPFGLLEKALNVYQITNSQLSIPLIFLKMFQCEEHPTQTLTLQGIGYIEEKTETHFHLIITEIAARKLIAKINAGYVALAHPALLKANVGKLADYRDIVLESTLFSNEKFVSEFEKTLARLVEDEPLFMESLRVQSGSKERKSDSYAQQFAQVAQRYQSSEQKSTHDQFNVKLKLAEALTRFSSVLMKPSCKKSDRIAANTNLRQTIALLESVQTDEENQEFKKGDRHEIKNLQTSLGFRK